MFNKQETEQLLACIDVAIKQSTDSFSAAAALSKIRDKIIQASKDENEDSKD